MFILLTTGTSLLKSVSERNWDDTFIQAQRAYDKEDYETALLLFAIESETGNLEAQVNFGYISDALTPTQRKSITLFHDLEKLSLKYWTLAASQVYFILLIVSFEGTW